MKVLKFGAIWCSGCLIMRSRWQEIEKENPWLKAEYFDYDTNIKAVEKYEIRGSKLPTFIFLDKKSKEILRLNGEHEKKELIGLINKYKDK